MNKIIFSYKDYGAELKELIKKIEKEPSTKYIDCIYGIPRGGLPIAVHLSHALNKPLGYSDFNFFTTNYNIILLVDDISDTGESLIKCINSATKLNDHLTIITATLHIKTGTKVIPDYFITEFKPTDWIVYPWERIDEETIADYMKPVVQK